MNTLLQLGFPIIAAGWKTYGLVLPWFAPVSVLLGFVGTRTGLAHHRATGRSRRDLSWWGLLLLFWIPFLIWILVQFTPQD